MPIQRQYSADTEMGYRESIVHRDSKVQIRDSDGKVQIQRQIQRRYSADAETVWYSADTETVQCRYRDDIVYIQRRYGADTETVW